MNKQLRLAGFIFTLGLILGFGYWQQQGQAAGNIGDELKQVGNKLKQLFSPAGTSKTFSPISVTAPAAPMATITVTSLADGLDNAANCPHPTNCRLRDALAKAVAGDTIDFAVTGTIAGMYLDGFRINKNLTISGPGADQLKVSQLGRPAFFISSGVTVTITGLKVADTSTAESGGGIINFGNLALTNCTVSNNAAVHGGGIVNNGNLTITDSLLSGNRAKIGINGATGSGGGIINNPNASLTLINSTLSGNEAENEGGGGIYNSGDLTVINSTISNNRSHTNGGGIQNTGTMTLTQSTLYNNSSRGYGGGGGGIYNTGAMNINKSTLSGNSVTLPGAGGGIHNDIDGTGTITNSTLSGNSAEQVGGGIHTQGSALTLINCTVSGNLTGNANNGTSGFGGGLRIADGSVSVRNTLIAGNIASANGPDVLGTLTSLGHNLIGNTSGATITGDATGNLLNVNPLLAPLGNYGGPTQTHALPLGGPAINAGNNCVLTNTCASNNLGFNLTTDQRGAGFNRLVGSAVDIGAFEQTTTNTAPMFTPAALSRQQGSSAGAAVTVGTVSDAHTAAGSLTVTQIAGGTATGITVTGITNSNGTITAMVSTSCTATSGTVRFQVSDGSLTGTGDLQVNLTANPAPTLIYGNVSLSAGASTTNSPTTATDNGSITGYAVQPQGTYTGPISVNAAGVVSLSNAAPAGNHTITIRATDNCGAITDASFTLGINAPNMNVKGNNITIANGDATPSATDGTDFGSAAANTDASTHYFTIGNTGAGALNLTGTPKVALSGTNAADFSIALQPASPVAATNGTTTFLVNFAPAGIGTRTATVSIANNDASHNPYTFAIQGTGTAAPANGPACGSYTNRTTANGLGDNYVNGVYVAGSTVYAATIGGLSISTDGGVSFTNRTTANGLGHNYVTSVYAVGNTVYAGSSGSGGLSISTDGGASFTVRTTANGLGNNNVEGVYVAGNIIYAATAIGLSISTDGGASFINRTTANGLGDNTVYGVYAVGSTVYAATFSGLSISTDGGASFINRTTANGLGNNTVRGVYAVGSKVYAATHGGLSISTNGGASFTNRTTANGLGQSFVTAVYALGNTVYAANAGLASSTDGGASFTNYTTTNGLGSNTTNGVFATSGAVYAATGGGLSFCTPSNPTITPAATLTRQQGSPAGTAVTIASVNDADTAASSLTVTATTVPAGITVTGITNTNGTISATVAAACNATPGNNTIMLTVTDGIGATATGNLIVNVTANTAPTLNYAGASVNAGGSTNNGPTAAVDNGSIAGYIVQSQGTYTGMISVNAAGLVSISNAAPTGNHTITIRATDNCGATKDASFTLSISVPIMKVKGNNNTIDSSDTTPSATDGTDFGSAGANTEAVAHDFTIENTGATALNLTGTPKVVLSGTHAADFSITVQPVSPVAATNGTTTFQVNFAPTATGTRTATVNIASNDASHNPYTFAIQGTGTLAPVNGPTCGSYTNRTTANGMVGSNVISVYAVGSTIYAATDSGLSISTDGGSSFINRTIAHGLGNNRMTGVYAVGSTVYAATGNGSVGGVSISTNGGTSFTNRTTANGLGSNNVQTVYVVGNTVYAGTTGGLSISINGGTSFSNRTTANGLGHNSVYKVYVVGNTVYAATAGGLAISTDGGGSFSNRTTVNGLGNNTVWGVHAVGSTVYAATNGGGLSISTDGGASFTSRTIANGLGGNSVYGVYASGSTVYAATNGGLAISTDGGASFTNNTTANGLGFNTVWSVYATNAVVYAGTGGGLSFCPPPNANPTITPAATLTRQQSSLAGAAVTIATVNDAETTAGSLTVAATTVPAGITVTGFTNTDGTISATVAAACNTTLGDNTIVLTVTDGGGATATGNLIVNLTANTAPTLNYAGTSVNAGGSTSNSPTAATDNGSITGYIVQSQGTYTGMISANAAGLVSVSNAASVGNHTITIRAMDDCGATTDATFTLTVNNTAPTFAPAAAITRQQGSTGGSEVTVGTVSDGQTTAGSLTVTQIAGGTATGITVTGITNTAGIITAVITASCGAVGGTVRFQVSDGSLTGTGDLTVNLTANAAPTLTYAAASVNAGATTGNTPTTATDNGTITGYVVQSQGTFTGTISVNSSGVVSINNATPVGSHTITIRATDNCGATTDATFTLTVNNTAPTFTLAAAISRQQGSVAGAAVTVGTVAEAQTAAGSLTVTQIAGGTATGITVSGITNTAGTITAVITASCAAVGGTVRFQVSDGSLTSTGDLMVNVTANTAPMLTYAAASVSAGGSTTNSSTATTDNGSITGYAVQSPGSYTGTILVNPSTGVVSISNAAPVGSSTIAIRATDNCGATTDVTFTLSVGNNPPTIAAGAALTRQRGTAGSVSTIATAGDSETPAGSVVVSATTVPMGIIITGVTNTAGTIMASVAADCTATLGNNTIVLTVTDGNSGVATANLTVNITANSAPTLVYNVAAVAAGDATTVNTATATDNGSITGYSIVSVVPPLLTAPTVNASGVVSITNAGPSGNHTITVQATDNCGATTNASFTLTVNCPGITVNPINAALPGGTAGQPYSQNFTVAGGTSPYSFTLGAGTLPPGVTLTTSGELSGSPTGFGNFNFTVKATDANGCFGERAFTLRICGIITLTASLPAGTASLAYNQTITASGGAAPYGFAVTGGNLPPGLNLNSTGALTGTPAQTGTFNFTVTATDTAGCNGANSYTVTVSGNGLQFYPLPSPVRLLETRAGFSGCTMPGNPINTAGTLTLPVQSACSGIPANAAAVTGNITVVPSGAGFLTLFPSSATQPTVANSNFAAGEITNNVFTVGLGAGDGAFKIFSSATTQVIVDVTGYYAPPGTGGLYFHPLAAPVRLLETRTGFNGCIAPGAPLTGTGNPNTDPNQDLAVQGRSPVALPCNSIPATAQVLVGNATSVLPGGGGYLTIYPSGATRPTVASSNYAGSDVINGPFAVKLGADGKFKIYTFATTHLVIDILGYYSEEAMDANGAGLLFNSLPSPVRLLETRPDFPGFPLAGCTRMNAKIPGNLAMATHTQQAAGFCGLPAAAQAVVGNVTVVNSAGAGFLTLFPGNLGSAPLVATSNYPSPATFGYNRHYFVGLGPADGTLKMLTQFTTDLIVDVSGYFAP